MAFDQYKYMNDYKRDVYDRFDVLVPKGRKQVIKQEAEIRGLSVSQLVVKALEECYGLDLSKP